jgi:hypothetical protein
VTEENDVGALADLRKPRPYEGQPDEVWSDQALPEAAVVLNARPAHPFLSVALPSLGVGAALAGVFVLGALARVLTGTDGPIETVVLGFVIFSLIVAWLWHPRPTEVRFEADGLRVRSWKEARADEEGEFVPFKEGPGFVVGPSGSFVASPQRKPVRVVVNTWRLEAAAAERGITFDRVGLWWVWKALFWAGAIGFMLVPWVGFAMFVAAYAVRVLSHW